MNDESNYDVCNKVADPPTLFAVGYIHLITNRFVANNVEKW